MADGRSQFKGYQPQEYAGEKYRMVTYVDEETKENLIALAEARDESVSSVLGQAAVAYMLKRMAQIKRARESR